MRRDVRRHPGVALTCGGALLLAALSAALVWQSGWGGPLVAAHVGTALSILGAATCLLMWYRMGRSHEPIDFRAGVATYQLDSLGEFRRLS